MVVNAMAVSQPGGRLHLTKLQQRALGPEDVEVRVVFCGVSRADMHAMDQADQGFPLVLGQEAVGVVTAVGGAVKHLGVGDRVGVGAQHWACLDQGGSYCPECAVGDEPYCRRAVFAYNSRFPDGGRSSGGFASSMRVHGRFAFRVPDNIPTSVAPPLFSAGLAVYTALAHEKIRPGDRVGVVGIGGLGHLALQFALAMGATPVAFSSTCDKDQQAMMLGAEEFYCTAKPEELARAEGSIKVLLVTTDTTNVSQADLLALLKPFGALVHVSEPRGGERVKPPTSIVTAQGQRITASRLGNVADMHRMLKLVEGVNLRPAVTKTSMTQINEAFAMLRQGKVRYRFVAENDLSSEQPEDKNPALDD